MGDRMPEVKTEISELFKALRGVTATRTQVMAKDVEIIAKMRENARRKEQPYIDNQKAILASIKDQAGQNMQSLLGAPWAIESSFILLPDLIAHDPTFKFSCRGYTIETRSEYDDSSYYDQDYMIVGHLEFCILGHTYKESDAEFRSGSGEYLDLLYDQKVEDTDQLADDVLALCREHGTAFALRDAMITELDYEETRREVLRQLTTEFDLLLEYYERVFDEQFHYSV